MQWRDGLRPLSMLERNELLDTQGASESVKEFLIRYSIDQSAAFALLSLPLEQQNEVTRQITGATNPSAVLLSRIKRVKQGQPALNRVATVASEANTSPPPPPPPPPPDETRAAVEAFLEKHCINSDACQSLWELSPVQQLQVISTELTPTSTDAAYDALMDRVSEILQGPKHGEHDADLQKVSEFIARNDISAEVAMALQQLPLERQLDIIAADLTGAKKPSAVLMSRIHRKGHGKGDALMPARGEVHAFLQMFQFDEDARRSFLELRAEQQNHVMREDAASDYGRCRNPSAYLMSRIRAVKESNVSSASAGSGLPPMPAIGAVPAIPQGHEKGSWWSEAPKSDVVETFLRRHNIDDGGREALHQLPAELQLSVLAHDHEIGQGGRNPSRHLVSLVGMAWSGTLGPPVGPMVSMPSMPSMPTVPMAPPPMPGVSEPEGAPVVGVQALPDAPSGAVEPPAPPMPPEPPKREREPERFEELPMVPIKKRKVEEELSQHLILAVEGFLRLNGIDAKSCRAMRRLPPAAQQKLIGMDLRHRRNPSAFLWTQIQKLRDRDENQAEDEEVKHPERLEQEERQKRQRPPERPPPERQRQRPPLPLQSKPQVYHSKPPSGPPVPKQKRSNGDVVFFLIRHGKGTCVPPSVEVCATGAPLMCGRATQNDIILKAQHVSKRHAEFHVQYGSAGEPVLMIRDLSSNGTWVRGEKIQPGCLMRIIPGDVISFLPPNGEDVPAFQVMENTLMKAEHGEEAMGYAPMAKPVALGSDAPDAGAGEVSEWIRSIGGGGKLSQRLIEEIEDSYDHLRQISENYRSNIKEFLDVHAVQDADEQEVLWVAVAALCSWNQE